MNNFIKPYRGSAMADRFRNFQAALSSACGADNASSCLQLIDSALSAVTGLHASLLLNRTRRPQRILPKPTVCSMQFSVVLLSLPYETTLSSLDFKTCPRWWHGFGRC